MYAEDLIRNIDNGAEVWEETCLIPTYGVGKPDRNPMFLEKRVYQGSSGKVYPHPVIDKIIDEKTDREYRALCLENRYLFIMILPELGGRIQRALDKTNGYDFVYYNHVVKPALVGLAGPWISGGIEFNWPQHHRPSTFDPVDYAIERNDDGSVTVAINEVENMFRTSGTARFTIYPDKAYLRIDGTLYNRTNQPQTFLWWANPAVSVNDDTQSIFPPDVHAVMDHGKRDVSRFPIAVGTYYKQDYSAGVDISRYKNIPVPTSYMAYHSDYDFVGGYDYGVKGGILHIADHHVSPGKKQWTWGCGDFGQAWDRNLTDSDGPYIELMTGMFTDNQPDFSWLMPNEEKTFTQYFMPYKNVGVVKNANTRAVIGLDTTDLGVRVSLYATEKLSDCRVIVRQSGCVLHDETLDIDPCLTWERVIPGISMTGCSVELLDSDGRQVLSYTEAEETIPEIPGPASAIPEPREVKTLEDLYLFGLHLEQYRHATFLPEDYYLEGLMRDPSDYRINTAMGNLLVRRGRFAAAEPYFEAAIKKITRSNPNPYDGEAYYGLGLSLEYQGKTDRAFDAYYKSTWNAAWQNSAFYHMACIASKREDFEAAESYAKNALVRNAHDMNTRALLTTLAARAGRKAEAEALIRESLKINPVDYPALYEKSLLDGKPSETLMRSLSSNPNWAIETAIVYRATGFHEDACEILKMNIAGKDADSVYPLVYYYLADSCRTMRDEAQCRKWLELAAAACSDYCFPHRLEDIAVLQNAMTLSPEDGKAAYYLGCLWYDKRQYDEAVSCWEAAEKLIPGFPTVHRNLALALFNKLGEREKALEEMELAFSLDRSDARVLMELNQLWKKLCVPASERLRRLGENIGIVTSRDDLYLEYIALHNWFDENEKAFRMISEHKFHPWEGGEGKVPAQYRAALIGLAKKAMADGKPEDAESFLKQALVYPHNLGEGKLTGAQDNDINYYLGCAYEMAGDMKNAEECWIKASTGLSEPAGMMYYNDQPPETIYYQGLALGKLGRKDQAFSRFNKLATFGETHLNDHVKIDYFAVSLPDLMIFDEDLNQRNRVHCLFMMGLGYLGRGETEKAQKAFREAAALDPNHPAAKMI